MEDLDGFIDRVAHLPPPPTVLPRLLALLRDPKVDGSQVVEVAGILIQHLRKTKNIRKPARFISDYDPADCRPCAPTIRLFDAVKPLQQGGSDTPVRYGGEFWTVFFQKLFKIGDIHATGCRFTGAEQVHTKTFLQR